MEMVCPFVVRVICGIDNTSKTWMVNTFAVANRILVNLEFRLLMSFSGGFDNNEFEWSNLSYSEGGNQLSSKFQHLPIFAHICLIAKICREISIHVLLSANEASIYF